LKYSKIISILILTALAIGFLATYPNGMENLNRSLNKLFSEKDYDTPNVDRDIPIIDNEKNLLTPQFMVRPKPLPS